MRIRKLPVAGVLVVALCLMTTVPARAEVKDQTGTFSKTAIDQADKIINQVKQSSGRDVMVEVFPDIPADARGQYSGANKDAFFANWGNQRANALKLNGIYVLVCRDPSYLRVLAGQHTKERDFTQGDCDQLSKLMLQRFHNKDFDGGLIQGMQFVLQQVRANRGSVGAAPVPGNGQTTTPQYHSNLPGRTASNQGSSHWWLWLLIIVGGGVFLLSMLRRRFASSAGAYGPSGYGPTNYGAYPPTSSGGFGRGMMGGLLGGMAGGWLYDRFRGNRNQANPPTSSGGSWSQGGMADADRPDQGQGFTGSGGDFGGSSDAGAGGDFGGGGDAGGGGDFGGGDSGSGGSF